MSLISEFKKEYNLKGVGEPEYYLGGNVEKPINDHWEKLGITTALSASTYIKSSVNRFEKMFGREFSKSAMPMTEGDHPELDDSPLCSFEDTSRYRSLIGSAN